MSNSGPREILFELTQFGKLVRVTAIDPATLQEVTIQGPASAGEAMLRRAAAAKLDYVNRKLAKEAGRSQPA
jgi:hypothetical protein